MESIQESSYGRTWLENLFAEKIKRNPNYSLRSFAKQVGVSPSNVSRILSGKRSLTFKFALKIADALSFSPEEREHLFGIFSNTEKTSDSDLKIRKTKDLSVDCFNAMSEWHNYGLTQLLYIENFKEDHKWISKILGITELQVKLTIERLLRLEILDRDDDGVLYRTCTHLSSSTDIASAGLRKFQKQILEKAIHSLEEDHYLERDITSITMAVNEENIPKAKEEIKKFRLRMADLLEVGKKTRVYNLGVHLIPLSESINGERNV
ncbi:TIGR02147 family protein [Halobacteriovorax sp.]|uniref:TIGR02147 family protein n=1 Tax=Halobacteriovorax sp. TaxID=2020862 RepID=UPI0035688152